MRYIFIQSHPIQYNAPLFKYLTSEGFKLKVLFLSDESIKGSKDIQFGKKIKWDIDLLDGYSYQFIKNSSWKPSIYNGFFGLINIQIIKIIAKEPKSVFVIHGWAYFSNILILIFAKIYGHKVALRGESPLNQELLNSTLKLFCRKLVFKHLLFRYINYFFYIGTQNRRFYEYYGVPQRKMLFTPYSVDNDRFQKSNKFSKIESKLILGLQPEKKIVLFLAKFIEKKRPLDLIEVFSELEFKNHQLLMVGDGELREKMENEIILKGLDGQVKIIGFINQSEIHHYYNSADLFVLCSGVGETWGLSVNEAMNYNLPILVSDVSGCSIDLVHPNLNGFIFPTGNLSILKFHLLKVLEDPIKYSNSLSIISKYSYKEFANSLKKINNQEF
jgi:glycosyltransferase involved in cell wall biosynthesis